MKKITTIFFTFFFISLNNFSFSLDLAPIDLSKDNLSNSSPTIFTEVIIFLNKLVRK